MPNFTIITGLSDDALDSLLGYEEPTPAELVEDALAAARSVLDNSKFGRSPSGMSMVRAKLATYSCVGNKAGQVHHQAWIQFCGYPSNYKLGRSAQDRAVAAALSAFESELAGSGIVVQIVSSDVWR